MSRTIVLAGAPESKELDWSPRMLLTEPSRLATADGDVTQNSPPARWRQLVYESLRMRPVLPKLNIDARPSNDLNSRPAEFLTPSDISPPPQEASHDVPTEELQSDGSSEAAEDTQSDFYDHSFVIHEALPISDLTDLSAVTPGTPTYESSDELFSDTSSHAGGIIRRSSSQRRLSQAPRPQRLTDLKDVPNAAYLQSIEPQTMTVDIIAAVLSIAAPRIVTTGSRWGKPRQTELVELLVGDETKTDFSITMWLPREMHVNWKDGAHSMPEGSRSELRRNLKLLRPRDVVLVRNVALSYYRGKVHGQSLKRDVTKIDLMFRKKEDGDDYGGIYSASCLRNVMDDDDGQVIKVKKVRDWMLEFVGGDESTKSRGKRSAGGRRRGGGAHRMALPADTQ